ncbi:hemerythrin domain-containing protein [Acidiferrobacter sp.]|uniref:hemerythrin domain-containing protein n=1 Tax=Acidiferrobacter sp. TaxID=1872107 RepID=UPI00263294DC|nr:hemerythrin domain-containing protein [Acidiferrobacter sp.]
MSCCHVLDLRLTPQGVSPSTYVYSILREMGPGESLRLWSPEGPTLLMAQLQNHMRHTLVWQAATDGQGYLITLHIRGPGEALRLTDTLRRDHDDMDAHLVRSLSLVSGGRWQEAVFEVTALDRALRTHILLENDLLAPVGARDLEEPTSLMRREHDDILIQLDAIQEVCLSPEQSCQDLDTWLGLLAASLNKHEFREETLLFGAWERAAGAHKSLLDEVRRRLSSRVLEPQAAPRPYAARTGTRPI